MWPGLTEYASRTTIATSLRCRMRALGKVQNGQGPEAAIVGAYNTPARRSLDPLLGLPVGKCERYSQAGDEYFLVEHVLDEFLELCLAKVLLKGVA